MAGQLPGLGGPASPSFLQLARRTMAVAMAAIPSPRPVRPSPSVVVAATVTGAPPSAADSTASASRPPGRDLRLVPDELYGHVADAVPGAADKLGDGRKQLGARRTGPPRFGRAEAAAEITKSRSGQQRIARRVRGDITIGMAGQPILARPEEPGQIERATGTQRVDIDPDAHPWQVSSAQ